MFSQNLILREGVFICKADARLSKDTGMEVKTVKIVSRYMGICHQLLSDATRCKEISANQVQESVLPKLYRTV